MHGLWKDLAVKEIVINASFNYFTQVNHKLDLLLPTRILKRCAKAAPNWHLEMGVGGLVQDVQPVLSWSSHVPIL